MPSDGAKETLTFDTKHCRSDGRDIPSFLEEKKRPVAARLTKLQVFSKKCSPVPKI